MDHGVHRDHYATLDLGLASVFAAVLWAVGVVYVLGCVAMVGLDGVVPEGVAGPGLIALVLSGIAAGAFYGVRGRPPRPNTLLAGSYVAAIQIGAAQLLVGDQAPISVLLFLSVLYAAALHPARRVAVFVAFATLVQAAAILSHHSDRAAVLNVLGPALLAGALAAAAVVWAATLRRLRNELQEQRDAAHRLARIDALTGLGNRRACDEALARRLAERTRSEEPVSVLIADVHDFKAVNDLCGHQAGDALLREVAALLADAVRACDAVYRWGGDEFLAILPGADRDGAVAVAARIERLTDERRRPDGRALELALGIAEAEPHEETTLQALLGRADLRLRVAKSIG